MLAIAKAGISHIAVIADVTALFLSHFEECVNMNIPFPTNAGPNML